MYNIDLYITRICEEMTKECNKITIEAQKDEVFLCVVFHVKHNWLKNYEHRMSIPYEHIKRYSPSDLASKLLRHFFEDLSEYIK